MKKLFRLSSFVFRLSSFVFRLSSFVFRLSSFVFRLSSFVLVFSFLFLSYACQQDAQKIEKDLAPALSKAGRAEKPDPAADLWAKWGKEKIKVENERLVFKNSEHFRAVFLKMFSLEAEEGEKWVKDLGIKSLYGRLRKTMYTPDMYNVRFKDHPRAYLLLLNDQAEVQYADTIVWYDDKSKHLVVGDQAKLDKVKQKQIKSDVQTNDILKVLQSKSQDAPKTKDNFVSTATVMENKRLDYAVTLGVGGYDARYQYQYGAGGHTMKIVFEVVIFSAVVVMPLDVYTRVKLEYLHSSGWLPAGEQTTKSISNLNASVYANNWFVGGKYNENHSVTSSGNLEVRIASGGDNNNPVTISCSGNYNAYVVPHTQSYAVSASW